MHWFNVSTNNFTISIFTNFSYIVFTKFPSEFVRQLDSLGENMIKFNDQIPRPNHANHYAITTRMLNKCAKNFYENSIYNKIIYYNGTILFNIHYPNFIKILLYEYFVNNSANLKFAFFGSPFVYLNKIFCFVNPKQIRTYPQ